MSPPETDAGRCCLCFRYQSNMLKNAVLAALACMRCRLCHPYSVPATFHNPLNALAGTACDPLPLLTSSLFMSRRAMVSLCTDWNMVIRVPSLQQANNSCKLSHFFLDACSDNTVCYVTVCCPVSCLDTCQHPALAALAAACLPSADTSCFKQSLHIRQAVRAVPVSRQSPAART
jgi:hypothetical protein